MRISSDVASISHVKIGMRHIVMPGARYTRMVETKLIATKIDETLTISNPMIQRSCPAPVET